jgi:8-oxo-dGTP diphosphatase/2-hydroxy-dATP diphosphatase
MATSICTLLLLRTAGRVLLGMKKRGFGAGKLNGFGGKVEPGETLLGAALREMEEESGLAVDDAAYAGHLTFTFEGRGGELHVHVFSATRARGEPRESDEMAPLWVDEGAIPYERMWLDDASWLPLLLRGERFRGRFHFRGHEAIVWHTLEAVPTGERVCATIDDAARAVLLARDAPAQRAVDY